MQVTFLAQLDILRWKYPEIARHLAKDLGEKEGEERRVGAKTGLTGAEKREATQETVKVLRLMGVEDAEELASTATKSGTAFLINGDHLRATLNHATRTSTSAHHNSAFLTTTRDSLGRATPSTFTVGNAIALLTFPSRNPSPLLPLGLSQVAVLAELYPEPTVEWGMRWSDGAKEREKVLLPLEEVEELVFCMEVEKVGVTKVWFSLKPTRDSLS